MKLYTKKITNLSSVIFELCRIRLAILVSLSAIAGYVAAQGKLSGGILFLVAGIFCLSCGASALNQYHEQKVDALMERTKNRPIPSKRIHPNNALYIALFFITCGLIVLYIGSSIVEVILGLFALLWYNIIYTYLKKKSVFAVIPGAVVGIIPPVIGWIMGGGNFSDPKIVVLIFFFFIWQIPHFGIFLLMHGNEYEKAGLPTLTKNFTFNQLTRILYIWILATAESCLLILLFGIIQSYLVCLCIFGIIFLLIWNAIKVLRLNGDSTSVRFAFRGFNIYIFLFIIFLSVDSLIR
ncbi:MAG: hypothetical protein A2161_06190 [Candidatus Schekmanbacteria bacterium RBG_13_48_7]|uniref:Protoheme IX farnesyltransferase n=1 Tax=Candidatus Schekmanbacteria bacterium RBG_13_48_7 TaxID=1817878 RepID=A0A1F7RVL7_9BACT|nr:MAG: hypothetical protein A2161_06190 [Candidatus Schekmanbacteria bacterium RBG_13_48_7]